MAPKNGRHVTDLYMDVLFPDNNSPMCELTLLHRPTLHPGGKKHPSDGDGKGLVCVLLSSLGRDPLSPGNGLSSFALPWKISLARHGVSRNRIRPCFSYTAPWFGAFMPTAARLGI